MNLALAAGAPRQRNGRCGCGSGRRFKVCHGRPALAVRSPGASFAATMLDSLDAQRRGRLDEARDGYERVLARWPDTPDALNMLGLIDLAQGDPVSALTRLRRAVSLFDGSHPDALHNLACVVSAWLVRDETERTGDLWLASREHAAGGAAVPVAGRISVVVPSHDHAAFVEAALASALEQDRPPDEIVVIDDGSTDGSVARIGAIAARHPGLIRFAARECRGAAATINEAVARSSGDWVNVLNSDDRFAPDRLMRMSAALAARRGAWGFSRCRFVDEAGRAIDASPRLDVAAHRALVDTVGACDTTGFAFLSGNPAISSGALTFARTLFDEVGGFRDLRYNHDWDFCLRATRLSEPVFVPAPLYDYRVHGANTIHEPFERRRREADRMLAGFYASAFAEDAPRNRFAPSPHAWGDLFLVRAIERGHARLLPRGTIERAADELLGTLADERDDG